MAADNPTPKRITVLISGGGTNLQAIIDAISTNLLPNCLIGLVISNRKAAHGLVRAQTHSIPTTIHSLYGAPDRAAYDRQLAHLIQESRPDLVVLAGFMHILSHESLCAMGECAVINLHPALPGEFDGARAIERAFDAWKEGRIVRTGVMVHRVIAQVLISRTC